VELGNRGHFVGYLVNFANTRITLFDSMNSTSHDYPGPLSPIWTIVEQNHRHHHPTQPELWPKSTRWQMTQAKCPQQDDATSCGVFVCWVAMCLANCIDPSTNNYQREMRAMRQMIHRVLESAQ